MSRGQNQPFVSKGPFNQFSNIIQVEEDASDLSSKSIWVLTKNGLWLTTDYTVSDPVWVLKSTGVEGGDFQKMAVDKTNPSTIYLINASGAMFKTTSKGQIWSSLDSPFGSPPTVRQLTTDFNGNLFVMTGRLLYKRTSANIWESKAGGITNSNTDIDLVDLRIGSDNILFLSTNNNRFYKSTNGGDVFNQGTISGFSVNNSWGNILKIGLAPSTSGSSQVMYALSLNTNSQYQWLAKSLNGGTTWTKLNLSQYDFQGYFPQNVSLTVHPSNPLSLHFPSTDRKIKTNDGGATWQYIISNSSHNLGITLKNAQAIFYNTSSEIIKSDILVTSLPNFNYSVVKGGAGASVQSIQTPNVYGSSEYYPTINNTLYKYGTSGLLENLGVGKTILFDRDEPEVSMIYNTNSPTYAVQNGKHSRSFTNGDANQNHNRMYDHLHNKFFDFNYQQNSVAYLYVHKDIENLAQDDKSSFYMQYSNMRKWSFSGEKNVLYNVDQSYSTYTLIKTTVTTSLNHEIVYSGNTPLGEIRTSNGNQVLTSFKNYDLYLSTDGGVTWEGKTYPQVSWPFATYFIDVVMNPHNSQEVFVATDKGLFYSSNYLSTSSVFTKVSQIPSIKINNLFYREADNKLIVATDGLGFFEGNAFQTTGPNSILLTRNSVEVCHGNSVRVPFLDTRGIQEASGYVLELSNANGTFSGSRILDTTFISPFKFKLPDNLSPSNNYKLRIKSLSTGLSYVQNQPINFLPSTLALDENLAPRLINITDSTAFLQILNAQVNTLYYIVEPSRNNVELSPSDVYSGRNITGFPAFKSGTISPVSTNSNQVFYNLLKGTDYTVYVTGKNAGQACLAPVTKVNFRTTNQIGNCNPSGLISETSAFLRTGAFYSTAVLNPSYLMNEVFDIPIENNLYFQEVSPSLPLMNKQRPYYFRSNQNSQAKIKIWVDLNQNGIFEESELVSSGTGEEFCNVTLPQSAEIGITKFRIRAFPAHLAYSTVLACNQVENTQTIDSYIDIRPQTSIGELYLYSNTNAVSANQGSTIKIETFAVGQGNSGNSISIQMSDASGSFSNPTVVLNPGQTNYTFPSNIPLGGCYRFRAVSTNPVVVGVPTLPVKIANNLKAANSISVNYSGGDQTFKGVRVFDMKRSNLDARVELSATHSIELGPGFYANPSQGGIFSATLDGCPN